MKAVYTLKQFLLHFLKLGLSGEKMSDYEALHWY